MKLSCGGDLEAVEDASRTFYAVLPVLDDGTRMEAVWANAPYVTYAGPDNTSFIAGWVAQKRYWQSFNTEFVSRSVSIVDARIHVVGNLAWQIGLEIGTALMKDGTTRHIDWLVTNVFEKIDGCWLMVSHHTQRKPPK